MTSRSIPFELVNVFLADKQPYTGNPLAVFRNGGELTTEQCQALGRQFNLSEITFPMYVDSETSSYHVRIFTPGSELPFAGHPTLGTCFSLLHNGLDASNHSTATQHSLSGATKLSFKGVDLTSPYSPARVSMRAAARNVTSRLEYHPAPLMDALGLSSDQSSSVRFVRYAGCGLAWTYACVSEDSLVTSVKVAGDKLAAWSKELSSSVAEAERQKPWVEGLVLFSTGRGSDADGLKVRARVFFTEDSVLTEDSATGSAALGLGLVLQAEGLLETAANGTDGVKYTEPYTILQGVEMLKPSHLFGKVELGQDDRAVAVHVSGDVVKVGSGEVVVP